MDEVTVVGHPVVDARRAGTRCGADTGASTTLGLPTTPVDEPASTDRAANEAG